MAIIDHQSNDISDALQRLLEIERCRIKRAEEAAAYLGMSLPDFRRKYRSGDAPQPIPLGDRLLGWRTGDLVDWVKQRARAA